MHLRMIAIVAKAKNNQILFVKNYVGYAINHRTVTEEVTVQIEKRKRLKFSYTLYIWSMPINYTLKGLCHWNFADFWPKLS